MNVNESALDFLADELTALVRTRTDRQRLAMTLVAALWPPDEGALPDPAVATLARWVDRGAEGTLDEVAGALEELPDLPHPWRLVVWTLMDAVNGERGKPGRGRGQLRAVPQAGNEVSE